MADAPEDPRDETPDPARTSEPVDTDDGEVVISQDAAGADTVAGGGEFPDPDTPPSSAAPGSTR